MARKISPGRPSEGGVSSANLAPMPIVLSSETRPQIRVNSSVNLYFVGVSGGAVRVRSNCVITVGKREFPAWDVVSVPVNGVLTVGHRTFAVIGVQENRANLEDRTPRQRPALQVAC